MRTFKLTDDCTLSGVRLRPDDRMSDLAEKTGLNRSALYDALSENGNPTLDTFLKVMCALDIKLEAKHTKEPCEQAPEIRIPA